MTSAAPLPDRRVYSVDLYRGLVLLLLLPDSKGAFSLHKVDALAVPGSVGSAIVAQVQHSAWSGVTLWDLVMPAFVFLVGVSMPLSYASRRAHGESVGSIWLHAGLRAATMICLGLALSVSIRTTADELWPLVILLVGVPVPMLLARWLGIENRRARTALELAWWISMLSATIVRLAPLAPDFGIYESAALLVQLGLAFLPALLVVGRPMRIQAAFTLSILGLYWLAFALYPFPSPELDLRSVNVLPGDEIFTGFFAHWNKNTNLASAFDVWFCNLLPRREPFELHSLGYQTLNFVPMIANIGAGVMAGTLIARSSAARPVWKPLAIVGAVCVAAALMAGQWLCPIVKGIWTPSFALFGIGASALTLAVLDVGFASKRARTIGLIFVVFGSNSILLYTLSMFYRWRILQGWETLGGFAGFEPPYPPVTESLLVAATLWLLAYVLYRRRMFVRI